MLKLVVDAGVPVLVCCAMIVVGLELTADYFRRVARQPATALAATAGPFLLLPAIGWLLVRSLRLQPAILASFGLFDPSNPTALLSLAACALPVIYVNAIACGGIMTPPFKKYIGEASQQEKRNLLSMIPLGRRGEPEEYASLAVYLASDEPYLVGQIISPNGGIVM